MNQNGKRIVRMNKLRMDTINDFIPSAFSAVGIPVHKNVERQVSWLPGFFIYRFNLEYGVMKILPSTRWAYATLFHTPSVSLLPHLLIRKDNGVRGFVPGYSGGTAPVFHRTSLFSSGSPGMMNHRTFRCNSFKCTTQPCIVNRKKRHRQTPYFPVYPDFFNN